MTRDSLSPLLVAVLFGVATCLGACSTTPTSTAPAKGTAAPRPTLAQERQRLGDLFQGTPVTLAMDGDGSLRAEVPLKFSFDAGRAVVKPPLGALLDRLAGSPATRGGSWVVAAPGDPKSKGSTLALERAASTRDYLVSRGADPLRFSVSAMGGGGDVALIRIVVKASAAAAAAR
ncbi:MAG: hypothetical protein Q7T97_05135 [Burkholderiaceae bacterium]|nr:hypothetical protein [Burkholderiaceae bacterium]